MERAAPNKSIKIDIFRLFVLRNFFFSFIRDEVMMNRHSSFPERQLEQQQKSL